MSCVLLILLALTAAAQEAPAGFRLVRSQSGPSGKVVGTKLALDDVRNRFVYPADKHLMVYFEWNGPVGEHALTAMWRSPDGKIASISPDIKLQTIARDFGAYWVYEIAPGMPSGVWTAEVRIDGQPAGSHPFELVIPEAAAEPPRTPEPPRLPSLDDIYNATRKSVVWVYRLDSEGKRIDVGSGFVLGQDRVATAFQNVDAAAALQVEFENGPTVAQRRYGPTTGFRIGQSSRLPRAPSPISNAPTQSTPRSASD